jgi:uncharacterized membrane protein
MERAGLKVGGRHDRTKLRALYLATLAGGIAWLGTAILAPFARSRASPLFPFLYACFSPVCHQIPERSFRLFGYPLAVCARCFGIYAGALGGLVVYPFRRGFENVRLPDLRLFIAVSAPIVVDTAGNALRLWQTANGPRFIVGFVWGLILPFYFLTGLGELVKGREKR